jgi:hypothetical protein
VTSLMTSATVDPMVMGRPYAPDIHSPRPPRLRVNLSPFSASRDGSRNDPGDRLKSEDVPEKKWCGGRGGRTLIRFHEKGPFSADFYVLA